MIDLTDYSGLAVSVAMTEELDAELIRHFAKGRYQEDLTFALWKTSRGKNRFTAVLQSLILPQENDRLLQGNVAFTSEYVLRVLHQAGDDYGIALLHSHLGPGWQGMSQDDVVAEQIRLASAVAGRTKLPLVGLTWGTDGSWSGRLWAKASPGKYDIRWAETVRVAGKQLRITYHPALCPPPPSTSSQVATVSVWGDENQAEIARTKVGIVGLGSVGSIVAEALSRVGVSNITLIDHDWIEDRNLDRILGAFPQDAIDGTPKVKVSERLINQSHTAEKFRTIPCEKSLLKSDSLLQALDCDVLFSCVDRPLPRHILNAMAYAHLIPVIDGGIFAKVNDGKILHADWRIHTVGPGRPCMVCLGAMRREDISLDLAGLLDDPAYIEGLGPEFSPLLARQNVFPFSLSVAAHEVLQFIGLITGNSRIGGCGPQMYHCYPGKMELLETKHCETDCEYLQLTASAINLTGNFKL